MYIVRVNVILSLLAVFGLALFVHPYGRNACKTFDAKEFVGIATRYVKYSKDHSVNGKFLGMFDKANIDPKSVRRGNPDEKSQDIVGVVPIDVGVATIDLQISSDCNYYPLIPDGIE